MMELNQMIPTRPRNKITIKEDIKLKVLLKQPQLINQSQKPVPMPPKMPTLQKLEEPPRRTLHQPPTKLSPEPVRRERRSKPIQRKARYRRDHKSKAGLLAKSCQKRLLRSLLTHLKITSHLSKQRRSQR